MMILSFPIGAYVFFNSNIGDVINFEYPVSIFDFFFGEIASEIPIEFEIGDVFIVFWSFFIVLFAISMIGPKNDFFKNLIPLVTKGKWPEEKNYLFSFITWFAILVLVSGIIDYVQQGFGITIETPPNENSLIQFFEVTIAPIIEEIGFRVLLIGLPLYAIYSHKSSIRHFFKSLWNPNENLHVDQKRNVIILILLVAIFFGAAHIMLGEPWSSGKFLQATASGIIIGWVYFRHGLVPAILIHWATNYFIFSYVYFSSEIYEVPISEAFSHSLINTFEILFLTLGILSAAILFLNYRKSKEEEKLKI